MSTSTHLETLLTLIPYLTAPLLLLTAFFYTSTLTKTRYPLPRSRKILLLIAHPDDEAMFFSPTLTNLLHPSLQNHLKILCLSSGNADGLGPIRKKELVRSAEILGCKERDVLILDEEAFKDGMNEEWDEKEVSKLLMKGFGPEAVKISASFSSSTTSSKQHTTKSDAPISTIDILLTFDAQGVSSHPNHIALYHGAVHFLKTLLHTKHGYASPVDIYTLTSVGWFRKYAGMADVVWSLVEMAFGRNGNPWARKKAMKARGKEERLLFVSDLEGMVAGWKAMVTAHKSQMRWFRWGWIGLSRYMYINDLKRVKI